MDSNREISDDHYRIFQRRIEILCRENIISQKLEYYEHLSFEDFINIFRNNYFSKLFEACIINTHIDKDILFTRDEIDLLYLILCEYFLNILKLEEMEVERFDIYGFIEDNLIKISIKAFNNEKLDLEYSDLLGFLKSFEKTRLHDLFIVNDGLTTEANILFKKG